MARGRKTALAVQLTPAERQTLLVWQRSTTISAGRARRGRLILLVAAGRSITMVLVASKPGRPPYFASALRTSFSYAFRSSETPVPRFDGANWPAPEITTPPWSCRITVT